MEWCGLKGSSVVMTLWTTKQILNLAELFWFPSFLYHFVFCRTHSSYINLKYITSWTWWTNQKVVFEQLKIISFTFITKSIPRHLSAQFAVIYQHVNVFVYVHQYKHLQWIHFTTFSTMRTNLYMIISKCRFLKAVYKNVTYFYLL